MLAPDLIVKTRAAIAKITEPAISSSMVDITTCDREAIHTPQSIQPHGVMIVLSATETAPQNWLIAQVSQNTQSHLGHVPEMLLGQPLDMLLTAAQCQQVQDCLETTFEAINPLQLIFDIDHPDMGCQQKLMMGVVHRSDRYVVLELEPAADHPDVLGEEAVDLSEEEALEPSNTQSSEVDFFDFYRLVKLPVSRFQRSQTLATLCQAAVEEVQKITGFDRVMVYRFDADGSGSVVAEVKQPELLPYLGLHYPSTDIPKQAKYLYLLNLLRLIPDVDYTSVPLVSLEEPIDESTDEHAVAPPLDMSLSGLRSVSPLHTEYLRNMGVRASMSISLVVNGTLWGLIACHHNQPRRISYQYRTVCEFLGQAIALELAAEAKTQNQASKLKVKALQASFVKTLPQALDLKVGLTQDPERLLALTGASGAAYCDKGDITLLGETPTLEDVSLLVNWLSSEFSEGVIYQTCALSEVYSPAANFAPQASGLLAMAISQVQQLYIVWFRPEVIQTVDWAGNPNKPVEIDHTGTVRMSPRQSFALWQQTVRGQSLPWKPFEVEAALELRSSVIGLVLQRADELAALNSELERSNIELDAFAYIASHDLKEPLRGIHNYSSFLIEDYGDTLGEDGTHKLQTLMRLTQRMENLISSLLHYSRLGRAELTISSVDLNQLVEGVIELVNMSQQETVTFNVPRSLPKVACDLTQTTELFTNLITNAIKYNNSAQKRVEVGFLTGAEAYHQSIFPEVVQATLAADSELPMVFYVKDNGIGIRSRHQDDVFRIFKRLHAQSKYGGGTGAGLTIAKKIAERHNGMIWLESTYQVGSCFFFTLAKLNASQST